jgi:hypothetical protein
MKERKVVKTKKGDDSLLRLDSKGETMVLFCGSLMWPMIDTYYVTLLFLLSMIKNKGVEDKVLNKRVQWLAEQLYDENAILYFESCN